MHHVRIRSAAVVLGQLSETAQSGERPRQQLRLDVGDWVLAFRQSGWRHPRDEVGSGLSWRTTLE